MAHHDHHDNDNYYIDQLCTVGIAGTFGVLCFALYFWKTEMLKFLLVTESIRFSLLLSGIVLFALALVRGFSLWGESKSALAPAHDHEHDHAHEGESCGHDHCDHDHVHACDHDHGHSIDGAHDHGHSHDHAHDHAHTHDHGDHTAEEHDHGSAPWRYAVLMVPVILFMLGLPNKGPSVGAFSANVSRADTDAADAIGVDADGEVDPVEFKRLYDSPADTSERADYHDRLVKVRGQITVNKEDPRFFQLVRFRGACCAADAQPLPILCVSKQPITEFKRDAWVYVTAKVQYAQVADSDPPAYRLRLLVSNADKVTTSPPDPNPYIR